MARIYIKSYARNFTKKMHKVHKSIRKNAHIFLSPFLHVTTSQNNQKCLKKYIVIFGIFVRKLKCTRVQVARTEVSIAKIQENQKKPKAHGYTAQTHTT